MQPGAHRVHHSYIWLGGLKALLATLTAVLISAAGSIVPVVMGAIAEGTALPLVVLVMIAAGTLGTIVLLVLVFGLGFWLSWRNLSYEIGPEEFSLYKGIISKKRLHVPYQRIQSVDIRATLLQRIAGVCSVEIDTAGGSSNKAIVIPYVTKSDAHELRHELFSRKQVILAGGSFGGNGVCTIGDVLAADDCGSVVAGEAQPGASNILDSVDGVFAQTRGVFDKASFAELQPVSFETGLSNGELLLSGVSDARNIVGAVILALVGVAGFALVIEPVSNALAGWFEDLVDAGEVAGDLTAVLVTKFALHLLPAFALSLFASMLLVAAFSAIGAVLSYGAFKVRRRGSRIEVERGLFQHQTQGVDIDRVQYLRIEHGWIRRKLGYCKVYLGRIDSASKNDGAGNSSPELTGKGMVVHPFIKTSKLPSLLEGLVPELCFENDTCVTAPSRARHRAVVRGAIWHNVGFCALLCLTVFVVGALVLIKVAEPASYSMLKGLVPALWPLAVILVADMIVGAVRGLKWFKGSSLAYGRGAVCIVNEGFTREEVIVPRRKIQFACLKANPFQMATGLRSVLVTTAAGSSATTELIWDIDEEDADKFMEWVRPKR